MGPVEFYHILEETKTDLTQQERRLNEAADACGTLGLKELGQKLAGIAQHLSASIMRLNKLEIPNGKKD